MNDPSMWMFDHLTVETPQPGVCVLTLDRPPVNALDQTLRQNLIEAMDRIQDTSEIRVVVLAAAGRVFCAGADIKEKGALADSAGPGSQSRANRLTRDVFFSLVDSAKPIIAAVGGGALGAGFVLAACCDFIIAAEDAYFAMPEIDVGQGGGASMLQRILPAPLMRRMLLTGERMPAPEMAQAGAVQQCVPAAELMPAAVEVAARIAGKSPAAVRAIRGSLETVDRLSRRDGFALEQVYTSELSTGPDADEARRAFFERRPPRF